MAGSGAVSHLWTIRRKYKLLKQISPVNNAAYRRKSSRFRLALPVNAARRARDNDITAPGIKALENRDEPEFNKRAVWKYE
jgi:hypothetical protein